MRHFTVVFFVLLNSISIAQRTEISMDWYDLRRVNSLDGELVCEPCGFDERGIPHVLHTERFSANSPGVRAEISNEVWQPLSARLSSTLSFLTWPEGYPKAEIKRGGKEKFAVATVFPFRKTPSGIERLLSFEIEFVPDNQPVPSSRQWSRKSGSSVLSGGDWYKVATADDGIYRITYQDLQGMGVNMANLDPNKINIYGNGGHQLPYSNNVFRYDDLEKNACLIVGEEDGKFDPQDVILFYARGPVKWTPSGFGDTLKFVHEKNVFSDSAYYFVRIDDLLPKRIETVNFNQELHDVELNSYRDRILQENDNVNLLHSGRRYFGEIFTLNTNQTFTFNLPNTLNNTAVLDAAVAIRSVNSPSQFSVSIGSNSMTLSAPSVGTSSTSNVANIATRRMFFAPSTSSISVNVQYNKSNPTAEGWLDYLLLNVTRELRYAGGQLAFRHGGAQMIPGGGMGRFQTQAVSSGLRLWNVSDILNVKAVEFNLSGTVATFNYPLDDLQEFVLFSNASARSVRAIGKVANQNLHALKDVDLVIVCPRRLRAAAEPLADLHKNRGLTVAMVEPWEVYNEFSSGNKDVTAIKMLMKMLYDKSLAGQSTPPKYLLLFGDGTFDNKRGTVLNPDFIITYQSANSITPPLSHVSDDYFGLLDDDDSESFTDKLDIGVGRLIVNNTSEGNDMVRKIRNYLADNNGINPGDHCLADENNAYGPWRNRIVFTSDDMDGDGFEGIIHMAQSDSYTQLVRTKHPSYDLVKLYMDAYKQVSTPGGQRYPEGAEDIRRNVQNGALIVNYVGHGGERGWAHERILDIPTIKGWTNFGRLPLFVTATCELARFDDPSFVSAGEHIILNKNGGAIALLTTTRIVYSGPNNALATAFYNVALDDHIYEPLTMGDAVRMTKNSPGVASANMRNFSLLGDPSIPLVYPKKDVYTTEINGVNVEETQTVGALQLVTVKGYVGDANGQILSDFNGVVYPTVFDKEATVFVQNNDGGNPWSFKSFRNIIHKGKASVVNGQFTFSFVIPKDISYTFGNGRISYYAVETIGNRDAHGHFEDFIIGGTYDGAVTDYEGPRIDLFMNSENFVYGGITNETPVLIARLFDENGINTVGSGIGHDIVSILNDRSQESTLLNDYFESDLDTYQSGRVQFQMSKLPEGNHKLSLRAWDVHNNSNTEFTEFVVASSADMALAHVLNYPNPFTTKTSFFFEHNQACQSLDVQIQVFTVSGKLVKTINRTVLSNAFRSEPIDWDEKDDFGDNIGRGVYVYRVRATTPEGKSAEQFEKLVILK
jgi:hypothetical protein